MNKAELITRLNNLSKLSGVKHLVADIEAEGVLDVQEPPPVLMHANFADDGEADAMNDDGVDPHELAYPAGLVFYGPLTDALITRCQEVAVAEWHDVYEDDMPVHWEVEERDTTSCTCVAYTMKGKRRGKTIGHLIIRPAIWLSVAASTPSPQVETPHT